MKEAERVELATKILTTLAALWYDQRGQVLDKDTAVITTKEAGTKAC